MEPSRKSDESAPRFSENARWAMGYANRVATSRGCPALTTTHSLAAIAEHADGDVLLKGRAAAIREDILASLPQEQFGTAVGKAEHLPTEPALKTLIQVVAKAAVGAPVESPLRCIELTHYLDLMGRMPECEAFTILARYGLISRGGSAAG